jgi:hypothetical protein
MCQKMYNLVMTVQCAAHQCSCFLMLFKCQPESTSQYYQACFCLEWLNWQLFCKTSKLTLKKSWQTGYKVISVTQASNICLMYASVPPLKTTKMKSVKYNEGGVNNKHVSHSKHRIVMQTVAMSSWKTTFYHHQTSVQKWWRICVTHYHKMVKDMCYTLLQNGEGYMLHITTKSGLRKKCPIILNVVMAHHTPTLRSCNGIYVISTNQCTQLSLDS